MKRLLYTLLCFIVLSFASAQAKTNWYMAANRAVGCSLNGGQYFAETFTGTGYDNITCGSGPCVTEVLGSPPPADLDEDIDVSVYGNCFAGNGLQVIVGASEPSQHAYLNVIPSTQTDTYYFYADLKVVTQPGSNRDIFLARNVGDSGNAFRITHTTGGNLVLYLNGSSVDTSTNTYGNGDIVRIELWNDNGVSDDWEWWLDGVSEGGAASGADNVTIGSIRVGLSGDDGEYHYDNVYYGSSCVYLCP